MSYTETITQTAPAISHRSAEPETATFRKQDGVPLAQDLSSPAASGSNSTHVRNEEPATTGATPSSPPAPAAEGGHKLSGPAAALIMPPLCLSVLLSSLDLTIVTPAMPAIVGSFHSAAGYIWVGGAFILANTAVTPVLGSVADIWGRKPIILIALVLFMAGSLLCAVAPNMEGVIAGRAVQGLGAAGMSSMVNIIICDSFSLRDRGLYLALTSVVWAVGSSVGPVIGGVFTTKLDWRWCFWINLPIGALVIAVLFFFLHVPSPNTPILAGIKAIDWPGSILVIGGALMVLLGLDFGDVTHPWSSATVICLIVFGTAAMALFFINEWKFAANPIVPLRLFSTFSSTATYLVFALNFYVFVGLTYYLPLYSQAVLGADALTSGVHLLPLVVSSCVSAACTGAFIQRTGIYLPIMYVAQVISILGVGLFITLDLDSGLTKLFIFEVLAGIGAGMNIEPPMIAAQAAATPRDTAAVVSMMGFLRALLTAVSVVIGGVLFQNGMDSANPALVQALGENVGGRFAGHLAAAEVEQIASLPADQQGPVREAYFGALKTVWIMYVAFAGLSGLLNLFIRAHHLSTETNAVVLGLDREKQLRPGQRAQSDQDQVVLRDVSAPSNAAS